MIKLNLKPFCNSEIGTLREVILCSPNKIDVSGSEVSAVGFKNNFDSLAAIEEHFTLKSKIMNFGCTVHDISTESNNDLWNRLVNRIFVRDVAGVFGDKLILGRSDSEIRRPDFMYSQDFFSDLFDSKDVCHLPEEVSLEFGDFMILNENCVIINVGHRSNVNQYILAKFLFDLGLEEVAFISLPKTIESLHLDVVCNILGKNQFLAAPFLKFIPVSIYKNNAVNQLPEVQFTTIDNFVHRHGYSIYWLPNKEYLIDYTNFINLDKTTALVSQEILEFYRETFKNMNFIGVNINNLQNGAGGIRCLTLPVLREPV
ncbi:arginine deiminase family protein [Metabacillus idriensis]|uniref:Arginine deiminase n=1 Tax=Metabacillus idriensis TaxID=324768 RepID=A0A6I2MK13_9BACI|nr:arginine deiminase family protein [Metabacillus idriensis]MCM3598088.1 arginine deiminase family protein [Metabacillus idriensis]MRX56163.1 hypothetical protein [Metabacillus idriensis]